MSAADGPGGRTGWEWAVVYGVAEPTGTGDLVEGNVLGCDEERDMARWIPGSVVANRRVTVGPWLVAAPDTEEAAR